MKKKTIVKIMTIALMVAMISICLSNVVLATDFVSYSPKPADNSGASGSAQNILNAILSVTQVIGIGVAVIMLVVLAIKYISASPGDKAEIKKHAVIYVVGAVILFAASGIIQIIKQFATNIQPGAK